VPRGLRSDGFWVSNAQQSCVSFGSFVGGMATNGKREKRYPGARQSAFESNTIDKSHLPKAFVPKLRVMASPNFSVSFAVLYVW
jgi:hypothetical protein